MPDLSLQGRGGAFARSIIVPGDKSLSHRALLFAAMADGDSLITGLGTGADVRSTASVLSRLGVSISGDRVRSPGVTGWTQPDAALGCGNSGTTMRLVAGILSTSHIQATLIGDESLMRRPMRRLIDPLTALGGVIAVGADGTPPIAVGPALVPGSASVSITMASAQVRTAFELAALGGTGPSTIDSPGGFRDHTERWLAAVGRGHWTSETAFTVTPGPLPAARYEIPGDPSSAAYLWATAAIHPGSTITTPGVSLNPGRLGFLQILDEMGAAITVEVTGATGGDPVGDVTVSEHGLTGTTIDGPLTAAALDELPLVAIVGAFAEGITSVRGAGELRAKESDRIDSVTAMVRALGGGIEPRSDGFDVVGTGFLEGGAVTTHHDHRIAMAAAVAATRIPDRVVIRDAEVAAISWPSFYATLEELWS